MSIEGIWTVEVYGPFGWDNRGIYVLEKGRLLGGDNRQYTAGVYRLAGDKVKVELTVHYYGPPRTVFGEVKEQFVAEIEGTWKDDEIVGMVRRPDKPQFDLHIRLTKRLGLPSA